MKKTIKISEVPYMVDQWDFENNTDDITKTSVSLKKSRYWKCKNCGYNWSTSPEARFNSTGQCPCCELNRIIVKGINDLFTLNPEAADSYDFEKNNDINVYKLGPGSHTKVYWKCKKCGYDWYASVKYRTESKFTCPCCDSNNIIKRGVNDVFTLVPELIEMYDFDKNIDLDIYSQGIGSNKSAFWKCKECGRSWKSLICSRIKKVDDKYAVVKCFHCYTAMGVKHKVSMISEIPALTKFWDYNKNSDVPTSILSNSSKRVFWKCSNCKYEWQTSIRVQKSASGKCPCCESFLAIKKGFNDILTLVPEAIKSYDFEKNKDIDIYSLGISNKTYLWWKCSGCGHEWQTPIASRIKGKNGMYTFRGCRQCYLNNKYEFTPVSALPKLVKFWDFEKNIGMDINLISANSSDKAWWICGKCGYEWKTSIKSRKDGSRDCPCCNSNVAVNPGYNDILTIVPKLSDIYDFDKNKNIDISSQGISSKQIAFFKCNTCGHEWRSSIGKRVAKNKDNSYRVVECPECNGIFLKYPELKNTFNEKLNRCTFESSLKRKDYRKFKYWWNCSICGNNFKNEIHSMIQAQKTRTKGCPYCSNTIPTKGNSFADINFELMNEYDSKNTIDAFTVFPGSKKTVKWICRNNPEHRWKATFVSRNLGYGNCPICNRANLIKGVNTFADIHKDYEKMWSPNNERKADETLYNSSLWLKWICPTCETEYGAYIRDVVSDKESCPYCIVKPNSLAVNYPNIAKLWSPNNERSSDRVLPDKNSSAKWICPDCNGEYNALISKMTSDEATCPYCDDRLVLQGFNSFAAKHPDLLSEWDYTNNYLLADPDKISENSILPVWWVCPNDKSHEYFLTPARKLMYKKRNRESCPYCKGLRRKKRHFV